jgi:hypothetical protein
MVNYKIINALFIVLTAFTHLNIRFYNSNAL